jgi:hypothetical protein
MPCVQRKTDSCVPGAEAAREVNEAGPSQTGGASNEGEAEMHEDRPEETCHLLCHTEQILKLGMPPSTPS